MAVQGAVDGHCELVGGDVVGAPETASSIEIVEDLASTNHRPCNLRARARHQQKPVHRASTPTRTRGVPCACALRRSVAIGTLLYGGEPASVCM